LARPLRRASAAPKTFSKSCAGPICPIVSSGRPATTWASSNQDDASGAGAALASHATTRPAALWDARHFGSDFTAPSRGAWRCGPEPPRTRRCAVQRSGIPATIPAYSARRRARRPSRKVGVMIAQALRPWSPSLGALGRAIGSRTTGPHPRETDGWNKNADRCPLVTEATFPGAAGPWHPGATRQGPRKFRNAASADVPLGTRGFVFTSLSL